MIPLHINSDSPVPLYAQLADQLRQAIARGELEPGVSLPTVRQLAVDLCVNMHTVAHAYAQLSREGLIAMRRGVGTYVQARPQPPEPDERARQLVEIMRSALGQAAALGIGPRQFVQELREYVEQSAEDR